MVHRNRYDGPKSLPSIVFGLLVFPVGSYAAEPVTIVDVSAVHVSAATRELLGQGAKAAVVESFGSADRALLVDVVEYDQVTLELKNWPRDEFVYLLEGKVEITDPKGVRRVYGPTDAFVLPKGFNGQWTQLSPIRKINVSHTAPSSTVSHASGKGRTVNRSTVVPVSSATLDFNKNQMKVLESWDPYFVVQQSKPTRFLEVSLYTSTDQQFKVEAERFEAVDIDLKDWPVDETFHVVRGHVALDVGDGTTRNWGPGDTFVMPKGFSGHWHQSDTVDLITVDYDSSGAS